MSDIWNLTPEEALAEELAEEALRGVPLPFELWPFVRVRLLCDLLLLPEGRELLAKAMAEPADVRRGKPSVIDRSMVDGAYDEVLRCLAAKNPLPS